MNFSQAIQTVKTALNHAGTQIDPKQYDGLIVKRLVASNTLDDGRSTNQTHIAITGPQMDIFPYLCADGYFFADGKINGADLKKYFLIRIPLTIFETNAIHLGLNRNEIAFDGGRKTSSTCVVRSKRDAQADQLQLSMLNMDGPDFVAFRRAMHTGTFFILLKCKCSLSYHAFGINTAAHPEDEASLSTCNNQFFRDATNTIVNAEVFNQIDSPAEGTLTGAAQPQVGGGENIILYGVPGCGKSYTIKKEYCNNDDYMERVVFHPDYTYSDFVGQILPTTDGSRISYPFVPGPFTRILCAAVNDPSHNYYLVIEEINRGNAPAIFGEVFQLLDREEGISEYGITNRDIASNVYFDDDHKPMPGKKVKIPANLYLLATMNTSDQNVFTLDTAFKRRWRMVSIKNDIDACSHANAFIGKTGVTWSEFAKKINDRIVAFGTNNLSSEDNRLGAYFIKPEDLNDMSVFGEKVLMYLWNDAFKFDRERVFKSQYATLEDLLDGFKSDGFAVFVDDFDFTNAPPVADASDPVATNDSDKPASDFFAAKNVKPELEALYQKLFAAVKVEIPSVTDYTTNGINYIGLKAPNIKTANFADFSFRKDCIVISMEKPTTAQYATFGEELPYDGHHNHYFTLRLTEEKEIKLAAALIVESYQQLKKG